MNRELREFIKEALEGGHSRDAIQNVLIEAGWQEGEVRNGLSGFADVDFAVAVPRPTPYLYAREAFFYLVSFIALYTSAISFGVLAFGLIDYSFPDALDYRRQVNTNAAATAIASVIVAFPLYLFLFRRLGLQMAADPERRQSLVRRWLTYITLVVAAGFILGDLIALLANLLTGDPSLRFILKAVSILAISGCVFGFYLWDMRQAESAEDRVTSVWWSRTLLAVVVIVILGCIGYALYLMGTPDRQRDIRLDRDRISHLSNISHNIDTYWELNEELPKDLTHMSGPRYSIRRIHDPESGARYEYRVLESARYELCAVFSTDTATVDDRDRSFSDRAWDHGAGRTCFELEAQARPAPPGSIRPDRPVEPAGTAAQ